MVRGQLEARVLPSAVLTSHRKSSQGTTCLCTGSAHGVGLTLDLAVYKLHGVWLKVNPFA